MNMVYGEIVKIFDVDGSPGAQLRVGRALKDVSLALVADAAPGDTVLVCDGMAIGKVKDEQKENHVSGNSW